MLDAKTLKKVVIVPAVVAGLMLPLAACVSSRPAPEKMSERLASATGTAGPCERVDAPMLDIPTGSDVEPRLRIPQPPGWEPSSELDNVDELVRFAISDTASIAGEHPQNVAAVTLETVPDVDPQTIFEDFRTQLDEMLAHKHLTMDVATEAGTVCGEPAEKLIVTNGTVGMGAGSDARQGHPVNTLAVVTRVGGQTYLVTVTTTSDADNPHHQRDVELILAGFQILPPAAQRL
jgi:hypothetical protein